MYYFGHAFLGWDLKVSAGDSGVVLLVVFCS